MPLPPNRERVRGPNFNFLGTQERMINDDVSTYGGGNDDTASSRWQSGVERDGGRDGERESRTRDSSASASGGGKRSAGKEDGGMSKKARAYDRRVRELLNGGELGRMIQDEEVCVCARDGRATPLLPHPSYSLLPHPSYSLLPHPSHPL